MPGLGTIINTIAIIIGGLIGLFFKDKIKMDQDNALSKACGVSTIFIGIAGAMQYMLTIDENGISSGQAMFVVVCLALGTVIGELIGIEESFERFATYLRNKSGNEKDADFIEAFLSTSFTVCIGAMAIIGAIQDGILHDYSILAVKSVLDFIIAVVMSASMGKGAIFSAIPVFILEGSVTLLSRIIEPIMSTMAIANLSLIGSILIFCVGINLVFGKTLKVANMLPAIIFAIIGAYLPF